MKRLKRREKTHSRLYASEKTIRRLTLTPAEHVRPKHGGKGKPRLVGKNWIGAKPRFRNLRWQVTEASAMRNGARHGTGERVK